MSSRDIYLGKNKVTNEDKKIKGEFVEIDGEQFYKITNYNKLSDFFVSIVSNSDHWMFISSNGSLSAGRKNRDNALFPYYTVDKIHDYKGITGSQSCFIVEYQSKHFLWEPFSDKSESIYTIQRNIYKSFYGNKIIFEELNLDLKIGFRYGWFNSERFGFIKKSKLFNLNEDFKKVSILDGITNILPAGVDYSFQNEYSNLLDAYKKNELIEDSGLGLFTLSSIPVDRAEPSEALYATTVWNCGLENPQILVSNNQVSEFKRGNPIHTERDIRARRGAYYVHVEMDLESKQESDWMIIAEINKDSAEVANLNQFILETDNPETLIEQDIFNGTENLKRIAANGDGLQLTDTAVCYARHYSNTLYNAMRGGIFADNYTVNVDDYKAYLGQINKLIVKEYTDWLQDIPKETSYIQLIELAEETGNNDLIRITYEYLPLTFSRRHGDPSRPWNLFSIETKNEDGTVKYNYEGNWRDIFQNWEALCYSFPEFVEGIISKFVNASTFDGYNPYRITRGGIDWECPDPDDPWAYIGYWGDHQIIYLQKLLELSNQFHPGKLDNMLEKEIFTYANVPYEIKPYQEILKNPKNTIIFNKERNDLINAMLEPVGADAKMIKNWDIDKAYKVNLTEKILATLLSKLCNFVPEAGIWLNTQRPEWNDANNALVGNGTSMVTLYYLRRFLKFWQDKLNELDQAEIAISHELLLLFEEVYKVFKQHTGLLEKGFSDHDRKKITDLLGTAHSDFRAKIYEKSFNGRKRNINTKDLLEFVTLSLKYADQSIKVNKRKDGLYHAYNLITIKKDEISIRYLYEMLEGQVAILSSGKLSTMESLEVLDALKESKMFREDQYSYMLYPDRQLPRFTEKNKVPESKVKESKLLSKLLSEKKYDIVKPDNNGNYYFNKNLRNAYVLSDVLEDLKKRGYEELVEEEKDNVSVIYEEVFDHQSFTGRSGTFYGYEGLGSIYWHMVSKLLLATQECYFKALNDGSDEEILGRLKNHYYEIKAGIGLYKSPEVYGAFPTDAYSHTPGGAGVKQPGLTGQVKEDVIARMGEMGVQIKDGRITFNASLINASEILTKDQDFEYYTLSGEKDRIPLKKGQLAFTFCQVPVILNNSPEERMVITWNDNSNLTVQGTVINDKISHQIFNRSGEVKKIEVLTQIK